MVSVLQGQLSGGALIPPASIGGKGVDEDGIGDDFGAAVGFGFAGDVSGAAVGIG